VVVAGATNTTITLSNVPPAAATNLSVVVSNSYGSVTSTVAVLVVVVPPSVTSQPQNQSVIAGHSATFSVTASGTLPINYQWSFNDATIAGATGNSYTIGNAQATNAGRYFVHLSNTAGATDSSNAVLTVIVPVNIAAQPQNHTNRTGESVSFSVAATGSAPLGYQWRKGDINLANDNRISGATNSTLTINNLQVDDAGLYSVLVSNAAGSVPSSSASLTIQVPCASVSADLSTYPMAHPIPLHVRSFDCISGNNMPGMTVTVYVRTAGTTRTLSVTTDGA